MSTDESAVIDVPLTMPSTEPINTTGADEQSINTNAGARSADGTSEDAATSEGIAKTKLCGVCKEKESKYKCTRCFLP